MVEGTSHVYICNDCIRLANDILDEDPDYVDAYTLEDDDCEIHNMKPKEIKKALDEYVVGQDHAKKALTVAVYNHYKRISSNSKIQDSVEIQKSNVLLMGPTGSGKTYLAQTLAKILNVPFAIADATTLTEAGYVGDDVENILRKLIQAADGDIERAEKGIIYVDEIDKITRKSESPSITRDVSGEGVQQALLKILEGTMAEVPAQGGRKHPQQGRLQINTKDILFICGGAFEGMEKITATVNSNRTLGFNHSFSEEETEKKSAPTPQDFVKFGMLPEFMGRVPVVVQLDSLDNDALVRILKEPKNAITKQYQKLFEMDGIQLEFEPDALKATAEKSAKRNTGARGLRSILEETMQELMFELPSDEQIKKCIITKEMIEGCGNAKLIHKRKTA